MRAVRRKPYWSVIVKLLGPRLLVGQSKGAVPQLMVKVPAETGVEDSKAENKNAAAPAGLSRRPAFASNPVRRAPFARARRKLGLNLMFRTAI